MRRALLSLVVIGWLALLATPQGVQAVEAPLSDPVLEVRAQSLAREIRCVVCENEPVALSSAEIAVDMRKAIRERIAAGDSDAQVRRFFADRYGEFVLLRPRIGIDTFALWGAPLVLLLLGGLGLYLASRRSQAAPMSAPAVDNAQAMAALKEFENKASKD